MFAFSVQRGILPLTGSTSAEHMRQDLLVLPAADTAGSSLRGNKALYALTEEELEVIENIENVGRDDFDFA